MHEITFMHELHCLGDLEDDKLALLLWQRASNTLLQIPKIEIFHSDVEMCLVLEPTLYLNEVRLILKAV